MVTLFHGIYEFYSGFLTGLKGYRIYNGFGV